jgi:hypothetical protein
MPFFSYRQNNSGGAFHYDEKAGISTTVIIEADNFNEANERALEIGLYFDGVRGGRDCDCCGDRWYEPYNEEGDEAPMQYGEHVLVKELGAEDKKSLDRKWQAEGNPELFIHWKDGRVTPHWTK